MTDDLSFGNDYSYIHLFEVWTREIAKSSRVAKMQTKQFCLTFWRLLVKQELQAKTVGDFCKVRFGMRQKIGKNANVAHLLNTQGTDKQLRQKARTQTRDHFSSV